jgi:hypothetical protein
MSTGKYYGEFRVSAKNENEYSLDPEETDSKLLRNAGNYFPIFEALYHRRLNIYPVLPFYFSFHKSVRNMVQKCTFIARF